MIDNMTDTILSLVSIMREESSALRAGLVQGSANELAAAKIRLATALETQMAQLDRERPDWRDALENTERTELRQAVAALQEASQENAEVLKRQIDLSVEMMGAIAAEAKRLSGTKSQTYGSTGHVFRQDGPTPISVNTRL